MDKGKMTIYLFTGTPGSGKSLHMARLIYWRNRAGTPIVANFELKDGVLRNEGIYESISNDVLTPHYLQDYSQNCYEKGLCKRQEGSINLFIDECQLIFNARTWNAKDRSDWIKFFTQHRKLNYDVFLIAQFDYMLDKQLRSLTEYEIKHRKLNNYGKVGAIVNTLIRKPVIVAVNYWYPMKQRLSSETFIGTKRYFDMYDTRKIF